MKHLSSSSTPNKLVFDMLRDKLDIPLTPQHSYPKLTFSRLNSNSSTENRWASNSSHRFSRCATISKSRRLYNFTPWVHNPIDFNYFWPFFSLKRPSLTIWADFMVCWRASENWVKAGDVLARRLHRLQLSKKKQRSVKQTMIIARKQVLEYFNLMKRRRKKKVFNSARSISMTQSYNIFSCLLQQCHAHRHSEIHEPWIGTQLFRLLYLHSIVLCCLAKKAWKLRRESDVSGGKENVPDRLETKLKWKIKRKGGKVPRNGNSGENLLQRALRECWEEG